MTLKQITLAVNDYCNNKCDVMCQIYKNAPIVKTGASEFTGMLRRQEFRDLQEVAITGGEPFMNVEHLNGVIEGMIEALPNLSWVFINTNGTYPERVGKFIEKFAGKVPKLTISISLEGTPEVHNKQRGVRSFELVMSTIDVVSKSGRKNVTGSLSTTITLYNADVSELDYVRCVAEKNGFAHTFRMASKSGTYYHNENTGKDEQIPPKKVEEILAFIAQHYSEDPFQAMQTRYLRTGQTGLKCTAGSDFAFVQADGKIYPCIFSTRVIGGKAEGVTTSVITDLGKQEPCPCCTECAVYPMMNYGPSENRQQRQEALIQLR